MALTFVRFSGKGRHTIQVLERQFLALINPRHMRCRVTEAVLCVCVVTKVTATYLVCESKVRCYKIPYGVPKVAIPDA